MIALLSLVAFAQTPPQPPHSTAQNPPAAGGAGAQGKIAIINVAAFRVGIGEFKTTLEALNKEFETQNNELASLQKQINDLKNKVQNPGDQTVQPSVRNGWVEQGAELEKTLKRKSEDYQSLFQKRGKEMVGPIMDRINKFLDQYCQQRNIVMVLERQVAESSELLVWLRQDAEITEDFINEYNKAHPSATPMAPKK